MSLFQRAISQLARQLRVTLPVLIVGIVAAPPSAPFAHERTAASTALPFAHYRSAPYTVPARQSPTHLRVNAPRPPPTMPERR